jgi:hypothetical protein
MFAILVLAHLEGTRYSVLGFVPYIRCYNTILLLGGGDNLRLFSFAVVDKDIPVIVSYLS